MKRPLALVGSLAITVGVLADTTLAPVVSAFSHREAGQLDGFPNWRTTSWDIELRAVGEGYGPILRGLLGLPDRSPNDLIGDGVDKNDVAFQTSFQYVADPHQGYEVEPIQSAP